MGRVEREHARAVRAAPGPLFPPPPRCFDGLCLRPEFFGGVLVRPRGLVRIAPMPHTSCIGRMLSAARRTPGCWPTVRAAALLRWARSQPGRRGSLTLHPAVARHSSAAAGVDGVVSDGGPSVVMRRRRGAQGPQTQSVCWKPRADRSGVDDQSGKPTIRPRWGLMMGKGLSCAGLSMSTRQGDVGFCIARWSWIR